MLSRLPSCLLQFRSSRPLVKVGAGRNELATANKYTPAELSCGKRPFDFGVAACWSKGPPLEFGLRTRLNGRFCTVAAIQQNQV